MRQTTLCVPLDVRPESTRRLAAMIELLRLREDKPDNTTEDNFARFCRGIPTLHFMSLSIFEHQNYDPTFVIEVNFDGEPGPFWVQFEKTIGEYLREMLRCCKEPYDSRRKLYRNLTKSGSLVAMAPYLEASTQRPSVYHHGNRGLTRDQILAEARLFSDIREELDAPANQGPEPYRGVAPSQFWARLRERVTLRHPWLSTPGPTRVTLGEKVADFLRLFAFASMVLLAFALPGIVAAALLEPPMFLVVTAVLALVAVALIAKDRTALPGTKVETTFSLMRFLLRNVPTVLLVLVPPTFVLVVLAIGVVGLYEVATGHAGDIAEWILPTVKAVVLGVVSIVVTAPWFIWWLRRLEIRDHSQDAPPLDYEKAAAMAQLEDWVSQNHMGSIVLIRPGMLRTLVIRFGHMGLGLLLRVTARSGYLGSMRTIHFAHWAFLNNCNRLVFFSNFDQSWGSYLDDFIEKAHVGLTLAWGCGVGFPPTRFLIFDGASHGRRFKAWALASRAVSQFWYSAYPHLSADQIERNHRVAEGLRNGPMSAADTREWMMDL